MRVNSGLMDHYRFGFAKVTAMPFGSTAGNPLLFAVLPVLPATASLLMALAVGLLGAMGAVASLRPGAVKILALALWRQKPGLMVLAGVTVLVVQVSDRLTASGRPAAEREDLSAARWPVFRGSLARTGHADDRQGPAGGKIQWSGGRGFQFYSSPALLGDQVIAVGSQGDSARLFGWHATSGEMLWTAAPRGYRATLSSAVVEGGYLICGEGLHRTPNSRVMCFQLQPGSPPQLVSQFSTASHIECTPALVGRRIFFGAGEDGIYCLERSAEATASLRIVWHVSGSNYPDAETALAVHDGRVYVGLGYGGESLCVLDADSGHELARLKMPFPVFSPPAIQGGKIYLGMGRANYVTQDEGSPGEVRCLDLRSLETLWTMETPAAVLAAMVAHDGDVIFSTVDGQVFVVDDRGQVKRRWHARAKMLTAPAVTNEMIYCVSCDGMLTAVDRQLERVWSVRLGAPGDYISSPIVYRGRVLVGTPDDGFLSVGEPRNEAAPEIWPAALGGPGRAGAATNSPIPPVVDIAWTLAGPSANKNADVSAPPAIAGQDLFVPMVADDWAGLVCAEVGQSGAPRLRWIWECPEGIEFSPVVSANTVVCLSGKNGSAGKLVGLDRQTGRVLWRQAVIGLNGTLSADVDSAYFADESRWLSRFSLAGKRLWRVELGPLESPIHIQDEIIAAVATKPDRLVTLDRNSGRVLWQVELLHSPADSPVIAQDTVFVPTSSGMEIRSLVDGSLRTAVDGWSPSAPTLIDRERFIGTSGEGELVFGSPFAASVRRRALGVKTGIAPLVGTDSVVFAVDDHRLMRLSLDGAHGPEPWFATGDKGRIAHSLVRRDGRIYVSVAGSGLVCLEGRGDE